MKELQAILNVPGATDAIKQQALLLAVQMAAPIAGSITKATAFGDGTFMTFLFELMKMLLPIILQLLIPTLTPTT